MVEDQLKEMDNQDLADQEQIISLELVQVAEDKATGLTHGAQAEAAEELVVLENMDGFGQALVDTQDTLVEVGLLQKDHQAEVQDGLTQMTLEDVQQEVVAEQVFLV